MYTLAVHYAWVLHPSPLLHLNVSRSPLLLRTERLSKREEAVGIVELGLKNPIAAGWQGQTLNVRSHGSHVQGRSALAAQSSSSTLDSAGFNASSNQTT